MLYNQSAYRTVIEAKYELDKRTMTFINHLDEHKTDGEQGGRSVKDLLSYEHVLN